MAERVKNVEKKFDDYEKFVPLDKSKVIRLGYLILLKIVKNPKDSYFQNLKNQFIAKLNEQGQLSDDLLALKNILENWGKDNLVNVGESGTLFRFLQYLIWASDDNDSLKDVIIQKEGTLISRSMSGKEEVMGKTLQELLGLDGGTSQWASAKAMYDSIFISALSDGTNLDEIPYKLGVTHEVIAEFKEFVGSSEPAIDLPKDETIKRQMLGFIAMIDNPGLVPNRFSNLFNRFNKRTPVFVPKQAEDYPFAKVFGFISRRKGEHLWPALANHESNRFTEVNKQLDMAKKGEIITSLDHRVVQALAMWAIVNGVGVQFSDASKKAVNKSWPEFWDFVKAVNDRKSTA